MTNDNDIRDIVAKVTLDDLRFPVWSIVDIPTRFVTSFSCWQVIAAFTSITIAWRVQQFSPGVRDERSNVALIFLSDRSFDLYFAIDYSASYKCKF